MSTPVTGKKNYYSNSEQISCSALLDVCILLPTNLADISHPKSVTVLLS